MVVGYLLPRVASLVVLTAGTVPAAGGNRLEEVQREIAEYRSLADGEIAARLPALSTLIRRYLEAYRSELSFGGPFDLGLGGPEDRQAAFQHQVRHHLRAWHPVVGLLFLQAVVSAGPAGAYARMLDLGGHDARAAIRRHTADIALRIQEGQGAGADSLALAQSLVGDEIDRLWKMLSAVAAEHVVEILRENLRSEPRTTPFEAIPPVVALLGEISSQSDCREVWERIREHGESAALAAALHGAATRALSSSALLGPKKKEDLEQLLGMLVLLQTRPATEYLILLFDDFESYAAFPGVREQKLQEVLVESMVALIGRSAAQDPQKVLALDVIDHLTRMVLTELELRFPELRPARVIAALDLVRRTHPALNAEYIRRFHLTFHALAPAGYEAVIFRLTDILVEYAENGLFLRPAPLPGETPLAQGQGQHQQVMDVLRWYNLALGEVEDALPDIEFSFFKDREQCEVLERIYGYFELKSGTIGELRRDEPMLIETMLLLLTRIAHAARPDDLTAHVLLPLTQVEFVDRQFNEPKPYLTSTMRQAVDFLWTLVGENERSKVMQQFLMQGRRFAR